MARYQAAAEARSAAAPDTVWALVADGARWSDWTTFTRSSLEKEGDPPPDGVGAIRRFGTGPVTSREQVVEFDPPRRLAYTILSGFPVRNYRATVELTPDGTGTRISWSGTFDAKLPGTGWFVRPFVGRIYRTFSKRLARAAEQRAG